MSYSDKSLLRRALRSLWRYRRWLYAAFVLFAVSRLPARTGYRLKTPRCDTRLSSSNVQRSLTKVPHIVLFGIFFLLTVAQFDRVDRRAFAWSLAAVSLFGLLIELEEGATRTGNCRLTDVLPDLLGGLIVMVLLTPLVRGTSPPPRT